MSKSLKNGFYTSNDQEKIPCAWFPPESILEKLFSIKSDVWAFGVTMWEIFTFGERPWPNMSSEQVLDKIVTSIPYKCSKSFYKIMQNCWSHAPGNRPTFQ